MSSAKTMVCFALVFILGSVVCFAEGDAQQRTRDAEEIEQMREEAERDKREAFEKAKAKLEEDIAEIDLPEDTTTRRNVKEIRISGNTLIPTDELLENMPLIYNASDKPLQQADSVDLYDLTLLHDIILEPGEPREVSTRTIQGFTRYIVSAYGERNYAGIYVYVPAEAMVDGVNLRDDVLPIRVLEASVAEVTVTQYDVEQNRVEEGYLSSSAVMKWSPLQIGQVGNQKKLDDFVNLLNLNPDRYVSAVVTRGAEPNTLAVTYDIYEADPWHYFLQVDNSGTKDRQWNPRVGLINTNLMGIDDRFTAMYQAPWEEGIEDNYSLFSSYDFPVMGPKLRLNVYGGYSEYDIAPEAGLFNFLGSGSLYGGILRYNAYQTKGWFFDVTGSFGQERSRITPTLFPAMGSDVRMDLLGAGFDIHRSTDMSNSFLRFNCVQNVGGSDQNSFWNSTTLTGARTNAERDFTIYTTSAAHSRYMDTNKVHRLSGNLRWITSDERLVPAKMTTFGGLYSLRGYHEYEIVADGGVLGSAQYEFDLVKYDQSRQTGGAEAQAKRLRLKKLAPLAFLDYGNARIKNPVPGETGEQTLVSTGIGAIVELGDNFSGAVYCGWPLRSTATTNSGAARLSVSLMMRW